MKPWFRPRNGTSSGSSWNPAGVSPASWQGWLVQALYCVAMVGSALLTLYVMRMAGSKGAVLFFSLVIFQYAYARIVSRHYATRDS